MRLFTLFLLGASLKLQGQKALRNSLNNKSKEHSYLILGYKTLEKEHTKDTTLWGGILIYEMKNNKINRAFFKSYNGQTHFLKNDTQYVYKNEILLRKDFNFIPKSEQDFFNLGFGDPNYFGKSPIFPKKGTIVPNSRNPIIVNESYHSFRISKNYYFSEDHFLDSFDFQFNNNYIDWSKGYYIRFSQNYEFIDSLLEKPERCFSYCTDVEKELYTISDINTINKMFAEATMQRNMKTNFDSIINTSKIVIVDFMFIGCRPCMKIHPILNEIRAKYSTDELSIISISSSDSQNKLDTFKVRNKLNYHFLSVSNKLMDSLNVNGFPTVIIYQNGKPIEKYIGYNYGYSLVLNRKIESLLE